MRRALALALSAAIAGGLLVLGIGIAEAHQCPEGAEEPAGDSKQKKEKKSQPGDPADECHETAVYEDWRPNYVPLFDLPDRAEQGEGTEGERQRRDAQRWREECSNGDQERQQCGWYYGGFSVTPYDTDIDGPRPNEVHVGFAANHCFLAEAAHDCDGHADNEFGTHDSHGGAIYADVCLTQNPDSKYCDDGASDTQAGVTIVDHLTCPTGCADEYHVVRPLDAEYTGRQMENSQSAAPGILADPQRHVCGYEEHSNC
jgi:hypothetical protein